MEECRFCKDFMDKTSRGYYSEGSYVCKECVRIINEIIKEDLNAKDNKRED